MSLSPLTVGFTSITKNQVFMFWNPNPIDNRSLITAWRVVFKNESTGRIILNETYPTTKDNVYIRDLNSGTRYTGLVIGQSDTGNSPQKSKTVTTNGVKALLISPKVYFDFNDFIQSSGDNYNINSLDGFIVSHEDVLNEKSDLDVIRKYKEKLLGSQGSLQSRILQETKWIKYEKAVNYKKRKELNLAILSDRKNIEKWKIEDEEKRLSDLSNKSQELESFYELDDLAKVESIPSIVSVNSIDSMPKQIPLETTAPILLILGIGLVSYYLLKEKK